MPVLPNTSRAAALLYLANVDERIAAMPLDPTAVPTRELQQEWAVSGLIALLGIGHALVDLADATRDHTQTIKDLSAEGAL